MKEKKIKKKFKHSWQNPWDFEQGKRRKFVTPTQFISYQPKLVFSFCTPLLLTAPSYLLKRLKYLSLLHHVTLVVVVVFVITTPSMCYLKVRKRRESV